MLTQAGEINASYTNLIKSKKSNYIFRLMAYVQCKNPPRALEQRAAQAHARRGGRGRILLLISLILAGCPSRRDSLTCGGQGTPNHDSITYGGHPWPRSVTFPPPAWGPGVTQPQPAQLSTTSAGHAAEMQTTQNTSIFFRNSQIRKFLGGAVLQNEMLLLTAEVKKCNQALFWLVVC